MTKKSDAGVAPEARGDVEAFLDWLKLTPDALPPWPSIGAIATLYHEFLAYRQSPLVEAVAPPPCQRCGELERDLNAHIIEVAVLTRERDEARAAAAPAAPPVLTRYYVSVDGSLVSVASNITREFTRAVYLASEVDVTLQTLQQERDTAQDEAWANWRSFKRASAEAVPGPATPREDTK